MASEIELKLLLPQSNPLTVADELKRCPPLAQAASSEQWLLNRYYDTPSFTLRQQRAALRLREARDTPTQSGRWYQTFKTAGVSVKGLSQRGEWESTVPGGTLDAQILQATPWSALDPDGTLFSQLEPCFDTFCHRTTWLVSGPEGARIEVALDIGHITAAGRQQPLLELELELLAGEPSALFNMAEQLRQHVTLEPSDVSKAQRGYALAAQGPAER